jgi:tetratricopeptide (TPR) repeat protein
MVAISGSAAALVLLLDGLTEIVPLTTVGMVLLLGAFALMAAAERLATRPLVEQTRRPVSRMNRRLAAPAALSVLILVLLAGAPLHGFAQSTGEPVGEPSERVGPIQALSAQVTLNLGSIELMQGTFDENRRRGSRRDHQHNAERLLRQTLEFDAGNLSAYRGLAELAVARNQLGEARRLLSEARRRASPDDSHFNFQLGRIYKETGSVDLAIAAWTRVDRDLGAWSCSSPDVQLVRWGLELVEQERYESAEKAYRAAIQLRPSDPLPYRLLTDAMVAAEGEGRRGLFAAREKMQAITREYPYVPWGYDEVARLYSQGNRGYLWWDWTRRAKSVEDQPAWGALERRFQRVRSCEAFLPA